MMEWELSGENSFRPKTNLKILSQDEKSGAQTSIIRYPSEWCTDNKQYLDFDEEFYILSGDFNINNQKYSEGDYGFLPAGFPRLLLSTSNGADVLTFFDKSHTIGNIPLDGKKFDKRKLIEKINTKQKQWGSSTDPTIAAPGIKRLGLRKDPYNSEATWLLSIDPTGMSSDTNKIESHPVVEEMFLISGEIHMHTGVLRQGAYFWRPPKIVHGPTGSKTGAVGIFRSKGGPLTTEWSEKSYKVPWNNSYNPILPEEISKKITLKYDNSCKY